jgi:hypothetical protein
MKRNVFGALFVAGGLALWTSVASFANDTTPTATPDAAIAACAAKFSVTDPASLTGEAKAAVTELNVETSAGLSEIVSEANSAIAELKANTDEEDGNNPVALAARVKAIETAACTAIDNLVAEYTAAVTEIKAESTQPNVDKPEVNKPEVDKADKPEVEKADKPEVRSTSREGND